MKKIFRYIALLVVLAAVLTTGVPVSASVANPDSGPFIVAYAAYENLYVTDDIAVIVEYNVPYASLPDDTATINFLVRLLDSGGTVLDTVRPFSYQDLGYNYGAAVMYFSPSEITWGSSYTIQLIGNPTVDWASGVPEDTTAMSSADWSASTTIVEGREQFCQKIVDIAVDLENRWNVALTSQAVDGTVLSSYGQQYFGSIVPYFASVCGNILIITGAQAVLPSPSSGILTNVTGVAVGSPVTLIEGSTTIVVTSAGTFTVLLPGGHTGTCTSGTATITSSPISLGSAITTVTAEGTGTFTVQQQEYSETYAESLANTIPSATTTLADGTQVGIGVDISRAASSMGMSVDQYMFLAFMVVMVIVMSMTAAAFGGAQFIPLLFIPIFVGCTKIGVIPMQVTVGVCAGLFIITMFLLIHRRATV